MIAERQIERRGRNTQGTGGEWGKEGEEGEGVRVGRSEGVIAGLRHILFGLDMGGVLKWMWSRVQRLGSRSVRTGGGGGEEGGGDRGGGRGRRSRICA